MNPSSNINANGQLDVIFGRCGSNTNEERKAGEADLKNFRQHAAYPLALLNYLQYTPNQEKQLRAAIEVKLWLATYKGMETFEAEQFYNVVDQVKPRLLSMLVNQPKIIAEQLSEAVVNLAAADFPDRWATLMTDLILQANNSPANLSRVVHLMASLTFKFTYSLRSDPLYSEIIKVCDELHTFLFSTMENVVQVVTGDNYHREVGYSVLKHLMRLFYNLNYQDLHPLFEDNLTRWMEKLVQVINLPDKDVRILKAKSEALKCILLFASKYRDDIRPVIESFSQEIWRLCSATKGDDEIVNEIHIIALKYFKHLVIWPDMKPFFANNLESLLQILILPHLGFNHAVARLFQDDPATFVTNYLENGDIESCRSTAIELIRTIGRAYKFDDYLKKYLAAYVQLQQHDVATECSLVNLVVDSGAVAYRSVDGVTCLGIGEDIVQVTYQQLVKNYFQKVYGWIMTAGDKPIESQFMPVHLALYLRFVYYFRLYVPKEDLQLIIRFCCSIHSESATLRTIVTMVLEALIEIRFGDYTMYTNMLYYFDSARLDVLALDILKLIYSYEQKEKELNKDISRLQFVLARRLQSKSVVYTQHFMTIIQSMLTKTDSYDFKCVLYVFEALGVITYYTLECKANLKPIEAVLDIYFKKLLNQGSDLLNFVFQLYSLIVQRSTEPLSQNYGVMYQSILGANNWVQTNSSLFSAYVQYLVACLANQPSRILSDKTTIEVILTKLIEMKEYNHFYSLLWGILEITKLDGFFNSGYLTILITGTTASLSADPTQKRPALIKQIVVFFCRMIIEFDAVKVVSYSNQISQSFLEMLLIIHGLPIISMIQSREERKTVFQGISILIRLNLLSSMDKWGVMLNALVENTNRRLLSRNANNVESLSPAADSYQKLWIFKKTENQSSRLDKDEERFLVESFKEIFPTLQGKVNIAQLLPESSQQQLTRLINKFNSG